MKTSILLGLLSVAGVLGGATHPESDVERAEALLKHADEALLAAPTLQATFTDTAVYAKPYRDLRQTGVVSLSKPGLVRVEITRARRVDATKPWADTGNNTLRVVDGQRQYSVFFHPQSTQVRESKVPASPAVNESPILAGFFGGSSSPAEIFEAAKESGALGDVKVTGSRITFVAGSVERQVEVGPNGLVTELTERKAGSEDARTWHLKSVQVGANLPETAFAYTPPADALPFARPEPVGALESGSEAPEILVAGVDGKPVHLSDYRGKVVVLKFWATWCWPCNQSLAETESLTAKYQSQGVETLAVAIKDSRAGFDAWLKKHPQYAHIRFAFEDPLHPSASSTYHVSATPTVYLIGRDGHIITENEGFTGPNPQFEQALQSAISAK